MHIAEGFLPIEWAAFWYLASLPFLWWGARQVGKIFRERPEHKLTLAVSGAFIFVLSSLKLPSVTGSSSHPTGTGLAAILYGPTAACVLAAIVLVFQALLLAHGGITTLGADIFSMGIAGPFVAYFVFRGLRAVKIGTGISFFFAAALSDLATYVVTSLQLALVIAIFVFAIAANQNAEFGGADVAGKEAITKINPDYKPWFAPLWQPQPETESMLFALQAAIGAFVIGYFVGCVRAGKKEG